MRLREAIRGHDAPLAIRTDPELRVHFVFRDDLAGQDVVHEQIVVHRLRDDLGDRRRRKLDESIVFRPASLHANCISGRRTKLGAGREQTHPLVPRKAET